MIITISGLPGAGKSTVKRALANTLNLKMYSLGDLRGKMAEERGMTIDEFNELGMTEAFTDKDADAFQEKLGKTEDNFVIDGRLSWYFIPQSVKIFLSVDPHVAAERIFKDQQTSGTRSDEPQYGSAEEAERILSARLTHDDARYRKWYGIDFLNKKHYDLVLDTTHMAPEETLKKILTYLKDSGKLPPV